LVKRTCGNPALAVPLYRLYNPILTDHFYTTNATERTEAITTRGYSEETLTGYLFPTQEPSTVPVYRVYSPAIFDHFYTTSLAQRNAAINNLGYLAEGITGYVYPDAECGE
jgi:Repeat of unknown function (DUF5648)